MTVHHGTKIVIKLSKCKIMVHFRDNWLNTHTKSLHTLAVCRSIKRKNIIFTNSFGTEEFCYAFSEGEQDTNDSFCVLE